MIFQIGIDLKIQNKEVQAIIDLDTGLIGFTEVVNSKEIEYNFYNCPKEFRIAFLESLTDKIATKRLSNGEIYKKGEAAQLLYDLWINKKKQSN